LARLRPTVGVGIGVAAAIILAVMACAFFFGPFGPTGQPDPTIIQTAPKPDAPFLWLFSVLSLLPASLETPFILIVPAVAILIMLLLPLFAGEGEKHWVTDGHWISAHGYKWPEDLKTIPASDLDKIPQGNQIP